jgi:hypothetical protein
MPALPSVKGRELLRALLKGGFCILQCRLCIGYPGAAWFMEKLAAEANMT